MTCHCSCTGQIIDQDSFAFANLRKEMEILGANTDNKFSFNSFTKISVENLAKCLVTSLEELQTLKTNKKEFR